jgi:uncharacterized protein (TIGR02145 family)
MIYKNKYAINWFHLAIGLCVFVLLMSGCKKPTKDEPVVETGTVIDIQGNVYRTVKIGTQWWMAENLKVTHYNDNSVINNIGFSGTSDSTNWVKDTVGAYCLRFNNINDAGLLYNWYALNNTKKIAPEGWRVPSDEDWKELERYLGMSQEEAEKTSWRGTSEGEKLKKENSNATTIWKIYNDLWATNESGFSAQPGSCRLFDGRSNKDASPVNGETGFWWSSTRRGNEGWYRYLDYKNTNVFRYYGPKTYGFSIRCIKN